MKRFLVISSSPRKDANSDILADQVIAGAKARGAHVEKVRLAGLKIGYCIACEACQKSPDTFCVQKDDMKDLYPKILKADVLVFASPIYWFAVSGQMKVFLDRTYALGGAGNWTALKGKKAACLFTYADPNPLESGVVNAFRMFQDAFGFLGVEITDCVHAACQDQGEVRKNKAMMEAARAVGEKLGKDQLSVISN